MSNDNTLDIADESRGPKHYGQLIRTMDDDRLIDAIYREQRDALDNFRYDEHREHLSPMLIAHLTEVSEMIKKMAKVMVADALVIDDEDEIDDCHALAWFNCSSYRHLWREARKRGFEP